MSKSSIIVAVSLILTVISLGTAYRIENENDRLESRTMIEDERTRLLTDQLKDVEGKLREAEFQLTIRPTYENGYRDALVRSESGSFTDGYAAAKLVFNNATYVDGYHNAIEQFGYGWLTEEDKATIRKLTSNDRKESSPLRPSSSEIKNTSIQK